MLVALQAVVTPVSATVDADLICLAVIAMSAERATPEQRSGLIGGLMYSWAASIRFSSASTMPDG